MEFDPPPLLYVGSEYIMRYCGRHPIEWSSRSLAGWGGPGDKAGCPPSSWVGEFLRLLHLRQDLFTQTEFFDHCRAFWDEHYDEWFIKKSDEQQQGLRAKAFRNIYPSMIDSHHVWSMLLENGDFDKCILDAYQDYHSKIDLTLYRGSDVHTVGLRGPFTNDVLEKKKATRNNGKAPMYDVPLPVHPGKGIGDKRWYRLEQFAFLLRRTSGPPVVHKRIVDGEQLKLFTQDAYP